MCHVASIQSRGVSPPYGLRIGWVTDLGMFTSCKPLMNPRKCYPVPHGPGFTFAAGRVLSTRRVGEAEIRPEWRAAKQNERPLQQAQGAVLLSDAAAKPAYTHTYATSARQSWISARRRTLSTPLLEMASSQVKSYSPWVQKAGAGPKSITSAVLFSAGDVCVSRPGFCDLRRVGWVIAALSFSFHPLIGTVCSLFCDSTCLPRFLYPGGSVPNGE